MPVRVPTAPKSGSALEAEVLACAREWAMRLLNDEDAFELEDFLLSGTLKDSYKKALPPHAMVAKRVREAISLGHIQRQPPRSGERVFYAVTASKGNKSKVSHRAQDLELMKLHGERIDRVHYLALNQKPFEKMCSFMSPPALEELLNMFSKDTVAAQNRRRKDMGIASIAQFMGAEDVSFNSFKVHKKRKRTAFTRKSASSSKKQKPSNGMRSLLSYM